MPTSDPVLTLDELLENEVIAANWPAIVEFVAEWMADHPHYVDYPQQTLPDQWREEML